MSFKKILPVFLLFLVVVAGYFIYKKLNSKKVPSYLVEAVGRIDADVVNLNTKYPARVIKLNVNTGDNVKKGEVIAVLDSKEFKEKLKALNSQIKAKEYELLLLKSKTDTLISKAKLSIKIKKNELSSLNAQINSLKSIIAQDKKDEKRIASLVKRNLAKHHELEMAILKTKTDMEKLNALLAKKKALLNAIEIAKHDLSLALNSKLNIDALKSAINALTAQRDEIKTMINELTLKSPVDGFIDTKIAQKGEVVGAGMPVVSIIDKSSFYLKIYVDEITNGKIKTADKAEIFLDSFPNKPIKAVVSKIAKRAEFTPKEVAVRSDRITRVYEVHLKPIEKCEYLKLGLPATGVILIGKGTLPKSLDELPEL